METVDIFPTLVELCQLTAPNDLDGHSLLPQLIDPKTRSQKPARGFWTGGQQTVRTDRWRLIAHHKPNTDQPVVELFDYLLDPDETRNHAEQHPDIVQDLLTTLKPIVLSNGD